MKRSRFSEEQNIAILKEQENGFVRDVDAAFDHQFFNIAKAQIEPEIHPNGTTDYVRMEAMTRID